jgi:hypothetical protein
MVEKREAAIPRWRVLDGEGIVFAERVIVVVQ